MQIPLTPRLTRALPALIPLTLALALPSISPAQLLAEGAAEGDVERAADVGAMASQLAALRGSVDALSQELAAAREDQRAEQRALAAQRADLELAIRREELRRDQLQRAVDEQRAAVAAQGSEGAALMPPLREAMAQLEGAIRRGLPYRVDERLAALAELEGALSRGTLPPAQVASRLWQLAEDELKLSRENAVDRQIIALGGEERLVEVARLGMVSLYFRAEGAGGVEVGRAAPGPAGWRFETLTDPAAVAQVEALFDALRKQIRTGYFEVPAALVAAQGGM